MSEELEGPLMKVLGTKEPPLEDGLGIILVFK